MSVYFPIRLKSGITYRRTFTLKDEAGVAINITGCSIVLTITTATSNVVFSTANGKIVIMNAVAGQFQLLITAAETGAFTWTTASHCLNFTYANGDVDDFLEGPAEVNPACP